MNHNLTSEQITFLVNTRIRKNVARKELCYNAGIAYRTLSSIERGDRSIVRHDTIVKWCQVLEIEPQKFLDGRFTDYKESADLKEASHEQVLNLKIRDETFNREMLHRMNRRVWIAIILSCLVLVVLIFGVLRLTIFTEKRKDYINPYWKNYWINVGRDVSATPERKRVLNYLSMKNVVQPGEEICAELKWSYCYRNGIPEIFVSAYAEWEPDTEIRLFNGDLIGEGSEINRFSVIAPVKAGLYRLRIFNASAHGPVISFYGSPPPSDQFRPVTVPYHEIEILVLPE
ncbi:hypothetical protein CEE37_01365 [candidate division LCP-89 bacterium B3_LCP]|uniref:HTH cro/C1-type domain-containing protein n=1 Tax=candidate division LCP-89 bacterium B3_LCP TaxID=2012998 RepID=A0A532V598_UNCL8|nr:MAG: hypothetical protein CEE37_01365 [candidate division LCP-89 bacterium B3_LCP]